MSTADDNQIGAYEAKTHFSELLDKVQAGEEVTITKRGMPVARLVPVKKKATASQRRAAIAHWMESSHGLSLGSLRFKDLVSEGRR